MPSLGLSFCRREYGFKFIHVETAGSKRCDTEWAQSYGHSRSWKLVSIKIQHVISYWWSTVTKVICLTVSQMLRHKGLKRVFLPFLPTVVLFEALASDVPLALMVWKLVLKNQSRWATWQWKLCDPTVINLDALLPCDGWTQRHAACSYGALYNIAKHDNVSFHFFLKRFM